MYRHHEHEGADPSFCPGEPGEDVGKADAGTIAEGSASGEGDATNGDRTAIQDDLRCEVALREALQELEREADQLEAERARRDRLRSGDH